MRRKEVRRGGVTKEVLVSITVRSLVLKALVINVRLPSNSVFSGN